MSLQHSPAPNPTTGHSSNATPADAARQRPQLASMSKGGRLVAVGVATLAASLSVGSQLGLLTHYSGEADHSLASLKPARPASRVIASAAPLAPLRSISTKFDPAHGARWPWEHAQQPTYARNGAQP